MTRKILSILLAITMVIGCAPLLSTQSKAATPTSGTCGENLTWTLDKDGTLSISGKGAMDDWEIG